MSPLITITETEPTPLLKDFEAFAAYVKTHGAHLTAGECIGGRDLYELNRLMTEPLPDVTPRTRQAMYPMLSLFYRLGLAGKLFRKAPGKGGKQVLETTDRLAMYNALKPPEKYFFLLETLWVDTDFKKLDPGGAGRLSLYQHVISLIIEALRTGRVAGKKGFANVGYMLMGMEYIALHFAAFGLCAVSRKPPEKGMPKHWFPIESFAPTDFGIALAPILSYERDFSHWNLATRRQEFGEWNAEPGAPLADEKAHPSMVQLLNQAMEKASEESVREPYQGTPGEPFYAAFAPLVGEGELARTLPRERVGFVDGAYVFTVALSNKVWRQIEASARHTLLDLHYAIQRAYGFDDDHLYSFFMDDEVWSDERFTSIYDDEGPHVDEVRIGDLGLSEGQRILYLFDYGDEWRFQVTLEEIRRQEAKPRKPKVVAKKGKAPEQYGGF